MFSICSVVTTIALPSALTLRACLHILVYEALHVELPKHELLMGYYC